MHYHTSQKKGKVLYALSGELSTKILSNFICSSRNLKVLIFPQKISRLINFVFSRKHVSYVFKTVNIGK